MLRRVTSRKSEGLISSSYICSRAVTSLNSIVFIGIQWKWGR